MTHPPCVCNYWTSLIHSNMFGIGLFWVNLNLGMEHGSYFGVVILSFSLASLLPPAPKVDFTYPSLEEPVPVPPVVAIKPFPTEVIENEETGDNLEERLKSLNRPNIQDAAVPKSDGSFVVNPVSITRSIPEVNWVSFFQSSSIRDPSHAETYIHKGTYLVFV